MKSRIIECLRVYKGKNEDKPEYKELMDKIFNNTIIRGIIVEEKDPTILSPNPAMNPTYLRILYKHDGIKPWENDRVCMGMEAESSVHELLDDPEFTDITTVISITHSDGNVEKFKLTGIDGFIIKLVSKDEFGISFTINMLFKERIDI